MDILLSHASQGRYIKVTGHETVWSNLRSGNCKYSESSYEQLQYGNRKSKKVFLNLPVR